MKKWLLVLGMITCMLGVSACGIKSETPADEGFMTQDEAIYNAKQFVESLDIIDTQSLEDQFAGQEFMMNALANWKTAQADIGSYKQIVESSEIIAQVDDEDAIVDMVIEGTIRQAKVQIIMNAETGYVITLSPVFTFGELMEKAFLNTLLGMGTVFVVLILICFVISGFKFIPKLQARKSAAANQKEGAAQAPVKAAVEHTIAQIIEKEELSDDLELAAVIAAAIAASQGKASADGFVVRSIRKARRAY